MNKPTNKMNNQITLKDELTEFLLYTAGGDTVKVETYLHNETLWLPQKRIAELFGVQRPAITKHLQNIFDSEELDEKVVCSILELPTKHGAIAGKSQIHKTRFYNLDAILSVGYRVNSAKATQFRIWATGILKEFIIKGFAMDDECLKNGKHFGKDYFRELLERVRSIRASERRMYQQITDIFAECSNDYDKNTTTAKDFFASVQNKFHFAITGQTAAEIITSRASHTKEKMGLSSWKNSPEGRVLKSDIMLAKNYLAENEIKDLEGAISGYFDYIERILKNRTAFTMQSFASSVNKFLEFNEYEILEGFGQKTKKQAEQMAGLEYDEFNKTQKIISDFDKHLQSKK